MSRDVKGTNGMKDVTCLADGVTVPDYFELSGINQNTIVVSGTGGGKTTSFSESKMLHTNEKSLVVTLTKRKLVDRYTSLFKRRGYKVREINFAEPELSKIGYDPLFFVRRDEDVLELAKAITLAGQDGDVNSTSDPYWYAAASSVICAEILLVKMNAERAGKIPRMADVINLHRSIELEVDRSGVARTNVDFLFEAAEKECPDCQAYAMWRTFSGIGVRTASVIYSISNSVIDKLFTSNIMGILNKNEKVDFNELGEQRTVLFITTSPMNSAIQPFINLLYYDMFRSLFESAEKNPTGSLKTHVKIIADDFACGSRIYGFENYISVFRAAGISVMLLLQNESQLYQIYKQHAAETILSNIDTYIYMGCMDIETWKKVAVRANKPVEYIGRLPLEEVIVCRKGQSPFFGRRYQTYADPIYKKEIAEMEA